MWFLQVEILTKMLLGTAIAATAVFAARKFGREKWALNGLLLLDLLILFYVSKRLCVFYLGYVLVTYGFIHVLKRMKRYRKIAFVLLCLGCMVPFFYTRATVFLSFLPYGLAMVGIAYNMLKAIDALYYSYYVGEPIPFLTYANYLLFFPVLTAGPIFRYRDFKQAFHNPEPIDAESTTLFIKRFIRGMFKKVVVLTLLIGLTNHFLAYGSHWYLSAALLALSYLTLFLDMSGYADMAIALGGMMGIKVPENFKNPLKSPSFTMFWRNWHITLSDWIREHIFVVVSGKRLSRLQGAAIGFFTMFFMSLWHGFSLFYVIDGILLGLVLAFENFFGLTTVNKRKVKKPYYLFRCSVTTLIFALNSLLLTLGVEGALQVLRGFFVR